MQGGTVRQKQKHENAISKGKKHTVNTVNQSWNLEGKHATTADALNESYCFPITDTSSKTKIMLVISEKHPM